MTVPVVIEPTDGQFSASLVGAPELRCVRPSRTEAIAALRDELSHRMQTGELIDLELDAVGVSGLAGRFQGDPMLREISEQIYRERDADLHQ